ncbi:Alpha/Beta hydrolase protein [Xylogone sp. PMI_703]|nr:Alpha/Beta hydrolase protein [Xylogone sp. PMI_703]
MSDLDSPSAPYLDPDNQKFADQFSQEPPAQNLSVQEFRKFLDQVQEHTPIPGVTISRIEVPFGRKDVIDTFIYRPEHSTGDLPVIFFLHGGGWVAGDHLSYDSFARELCLRSGCAVVFPEYTLVPEKIFPVQNEQCFSVVKYTAKNGKSMGLRTDKFGIADDSAGGQLSVAVINLIRQAHLEKSIPIVFQVLFSPATNLTDLPNNLNLSEFKYMNAPVLTVATTTAFFNQYIPNPKDRESIFASPLLMDKEQASHQPPTLITVSEVDPVRTEAGQFAKLLQTSGVRCGLIRAEAQVHDTAFFEPTRNGPTAHALVLMAAASFNEALTPMSNISKKREVEEEGQGNLKKTTKRTVKRRRRL